MKKIYYLLILLLSLPIIVHAEINDYYINATVEKNGDLKVEEYFILDGTYNGFERKIDYANSNAATFNPNATSFGGSTIHNGTGVNIDAVKGLKINSNFNFTKIPKSNFKKVSSANAGEYGKYTLSNRPNGVSVKIFNPSRKHKAFYIEYTLKNMAIMHNDVGEIGWNILGNELTEDIDYLHLYLNLLGSTNVRVWGHGPLNGETKIISNDKLELKINNLSMNTPIDIRAVFDKSVIPDSTKKTGVDALDKILTYENQMAEDANNRRNENANDNITRANVQLNACEMEYFPTWDCYISAETLVNLIPDTNTYKYTKISYLDRLDNLKKKVFQSENKDANLQLDTLKKDMTYESYEKAKDSIEKMHDEDKQRELSVQLNDLKNKLAQTESDRSNKNIILNSMYIIILVLTYAIIYHFLGKSPKAKFSQKYYRDIPENITPWELEYLMNHKITSKSLSAGLLFLINKGKIKCEKVGTGKDDYKLTVINTDELTKSEEELLKLLFSDFETPKIGSKVNLRDFKERSKHVNSSFLDFLEKFKYVAQEESEAKKLYAADNLQKDKYDFNKTKFIIGLLILIVMDMPIIYLEYGITNIVPRNMGTLFEFETLMLIGYAIYGIIFLYLLWYLIKFYNQSKIYISKLIRVIIASLFILFLSVIVITNVSYLYLLHFNYSSLIFGIIACILCVCMIRKLPYMYKYSDDGIEKYQKWLAFKNYLNDFSNFNNKDLPEIKIWENYLVYAVVLGCAKKLTKVTKIVFGQNTDSNAYGNYLYYMVLSDNLVSSLHSTYRSAIAISTLGGISSGVSSHSSGSGGGGGFSSGGGTFGGGGGGSRF